MGQINLPEKMYADIVFPRNNEKEFIELAATLSYNALFFAYPLDKGLKPGEKIKELTESCNGYKLSLYPAVMASLNEIPKAKRAGLVVVKSSEQDRAVLERQGADVLFGLGETGRDRLHHRLSGLNQVLCRLASLNNICIGFSFSSLLNANDIQRATIIGRMKQNTRLCRKYRVKTIIASFAERPFQMRSPHDLISFGITLGMHPSEAKKSLVNVLEKASQKPKL